MRILFCSDPLQPRRPDEAYATEVAAVEAVGAGYDLVNFEALVDEGDAERAVRLVPSRAAPELAAYRGWMVRPAQYALLYEALAARGLRLINDPAAYLFCHELPASYPAIAGHTPRTVWMRTDGDVSVDAVMDLLRPFGDGPVVLKDFVKSRKHEWDEACFIPSASDREAVERVVRRFLELQGNDLNEGLVFREFVRFTPLGTHTKSGMPLTKEYRIFVLDGEPVDTVEYWEEGAYEGPPPPIDQFREVIAAIPSRFFTMDIAQRRNGGWTIVELGDGQVAGLPERADPLRFYERLLGRPTTARPDAALS